MRSKRRTRHQHPNDALLKEAVTILARLNFLEGEWQDGEGVTLTLSGRLAQRVRERTLQLVHEEDIA